MAQDPFSNVLSLARHFDPRKSLESAHCAREKSRLFCRMLKSHLFNGEYEQIETLMDDLSDTNLRNDYLAISTTLDALENLYVCSPGLAVDRVAEIAFFAADEGSWLKKRAVGFWIDKIRHLTGDMLEAGYIEGHDFVTKHYDEESLSSLVPSVPKGIVMKQSFLDPQYYALENLANVAEAVVDPDDSDDVKSLWFEIMVRLTHGDMDHKLSRYLSFKREQGGVVAGYVDEFLGNYDWERNIYVEKQAEACPLMKRVK